MGTTDDKADYIVTFGLVRQHKYLSHVKKKKSQPKEQHWFRLKFYSSWCVNKDACTKRSMHLHIQIKGQKSDPLFSRPIRLSFFKHPITAF